MDLFQQGMKGPTRPAPSIPSFVNRYSPVTNWNDDPFGDVFEPNPPFAQKKKPPPRPPPPKINNKQPDVPAKPSHFLRRPTVLTSLLQRKSKMTQQSTVTPSSTYSHSSISQHTQSYGNHSTIFQDGAREVDANKLFPKCDQKSIQTGTLIDLSSPPSSPTFTTRSSSDGLSVDSFGSDATTSTNNHNALNGNSSQAESGFEDDFDLFLYSKKNIQKDDTFDDFKLVDPFSPPPVSNKPPVLKNPVLNRDPFDMSCVVSSQPSVPSLKGPTIIRAKPSRPKPPDSTALLKNAFGDSLPVTSMTLNTTRPIQKVSSFGDSDSFEPKPISWESESSSERESSPPMPSIPPPPPPAIIDDDLAWPDDEVEPPADDEEPHAIALFDYFTNHAEDLCFSKNTKIKLIRRIDHEWLYGSLRTGAEGMFPSNYVEIKVPIPGDHIGTATALYDFEPVQNGDLKFMTGDKITVISKISEEWFYGECNGRKGQFPVNYVQMQ